METINNNGFLNRPKHHDTFYSILIIALITVVILFLTGVLKFHKEQAVKVITVKVDTAMCDSIPVLDKKILDALCPILKKREGLELKPYKDIKGIEYIAYGHTNLEHLQVVTDAQADSIILSDIRNAYFEVQRIHRKTLYSDVYSVFTSGTINGNKP